jgi:two-component system sensor histidine kinase MtrB
LTIAFVATAVLVSSVFAITSFLLVRSYRMHTFTRHIHREARLALLAAPHDLSASSFSAVLGEYEQRGDFETVASADGVEYSSTSALDLSAVPRELRDEPVTGTSDPVFVRIGGRPYAVISGAAPGKNARLYFFFGREEVLASIRDMRNLLVAGWCIALVGGMLAGRFLARRTLRPVGDVANASVRLTRDLTGRTIDVDTTDEVANLVLAFNEMATAVTEKVDELSTMAERERRVTADIAHDLRTPLTSLAALTTVVSERVDELPPDLRRPMELLLDSVERLQRLAADLLELARLDAHSTDLQLVPTPVVPLVRQVLAEFGQHPRLAVDGKEWAHANPLRLRRVLANVVENAVVHAGGVAVVRVHGRGDWCAIDVDDMGPGVPDTALERIFDRFHKADPSRSTSGSGLGLAIVRQEAESQGGRVCARNLRPGFRCTIELPAAGGTDGSRRAHEAGEEARPLDGEPLDATR